MKDEAKEIQARIEKYHKITRWGLITGAIAWTIDIALHVLWDD